MKVPSPRSPAPNMTNGESSSWDAAPVFTLHYDLKTETDQAFGFM